MKRVMRTFLLFTMTILGAAHDGFADSSSHDACSRLASDVRSAKTSLEAYFAGHYQFPEEFELTSFEPSEGVVLIYEKRSVNGPADEYVLRAYDEACDTIYVTSSRSTEIRAFTSLKQAPPREVVPPQTSVTVLLNALLGALILLVLVLVLRIRSLARLLREGKSEKMQASPDD